jgi:hypothetical protein
VFSVNTIGYLSDYSTNAPSALHYLDTKVIPQMIEAGAHFCDIRDAEGKHQGWATRTGTDTRPSSLQRAEELHSALVDKNRTYGPTDVSCGTSATSLPKAIVAEKD